MKITCLKEDVPAAMELLADVAQNAKLDDAAVTAARPACIDAMKDWEDCLPTQIMNNMHRSCYDTTDSIPGQGLGLAPLGTNANVKGAVLAQDVWAFHKQTYLNASHMALVVSGADDEEAVNTKADALFGSAPTGPAPVVGKRYVGGSVKMSQGAPQPPRAQTSSGSSCASSVATFRRRNCSPASTV